MSGGGGESQAARAHEVQPFSGCAAHRKQCRYAVGVSRCQPMGWPCKLLWTTQRRRGRAAPGPGAGTLPKQLDGRPRAGQRVYRRFRGNLRLRRDGRGLLPWQVYRLTRAEADTGPINSVNMVSLLAGPAQLSLSPLGPATFAVGFVEGECVPAPCCRWRVGPEFAPARVGSRSGHSVSPSLLRAHRPLRSSFPGGSAHHSPAGVAALSSGDPEALCRRGA